MKEDDEVAKKSKSLPKRSDIPDERKWKLEDIFSKDEEWEQEFKQLKEDFPQIEKYQGKIAESAQNLYEVLKTQDDLSMRLGQLFTYAHMRYDEDTTNSFY